jgi:hypothetical protein
VGKFLYYARAVDPTMLTAINKLGATQALPTQAIRASIQRFLAYASTCPNAELVYKASDMQLIVESDASYLSESESRSRAGGFCYLSSCDPLKTKVNGGIEYMSTIITSVVSSAFKAE